MGMVQYTVAARQPVTFLRISSGSLISSDLSMSYASTDQLLTKSASNKTTTLVAEQKTAAA